FILVMIALFIVGCSSETNKHLVVKDKIHPALQMLSVPAGLGVNIHFFEGNKNDLSMLKESGVGIVRMDISWGGFEKTKGKYDFSRHDKLIEDLEELGIRLLFIIDYGNPLYDDGFSPYTEEGREAYTKFCSALAERYSGKAIIWELWNEPNIDNFWKPKVNIDDYMAFCQAVVPVIREKDQNACIIAPATSTFDMKFMESCFEKGLLDLVDGVSVHPYRNPELSPETTFDEYQLLSLLIEQHKPEGKAIPILSGEWGYSTTVLSRKLQGKYLARQWLFNFAYDVPISIWYDWHDDGQDPKEAEHNFGTVTWDYKEKPSFVAMKTLIEQFKGYLPIGRVSLGSIDDYMLLFQKNDEVKLALWSTSDKHNITLGTEIKFLEEVNYLGKEIKVSNENITISDEPIYVELAKPYPDWVDMVSNVNSISSNEVEDIIQALLTKSEENKFASRISNYLKSEKPMRHRAALYSLLLLANKINTKEALEVYYHILTVSKDLLSSKLALLEIAKVASTESLGDVAIQMNNEEMLKEVSL
ncbi:MAG: cellulase family glycosylhydrolase, partial [Melioribacteraceae bacterium]|nr:cellulase family glycosylhydrolase [Melioribacteraceae bacterium]